MKKLAAIALVLLFVCAVPFGAFAHGHGMGSAAKRTYSVCNVENCNVSDRHAHGNGDYYGHYVGDGHDYHAVCSVAGCAIAGSHEHNGVTCFGSGYSGGSSHCGRRR